MSLGTHVHLVYPATVEDASTQLLRSRRAEPEKRTRDRGQKKGEGGKPEARDQAQGSARTAQAKGGGAYAQSGRITAYE